MAGAQNRARCNVRRYAPAKVNPANNSALKNSKTVIVPTDDYDVFGDGTVVLRMAPGHTPGHQVLFLKLNKTGPVVLSGDLYHIRKSAR